MAFSTKNLEFSTIYATYPVLYRFSRGTIKG